MLRKDILTQHFKGIHMIEGCSGIRAPYLALLRVLKTYFGNALPITSESIEFDPKVVKIQNAMYKTNVEPISITDYHPDPKWVGITEILKIMFSGTPCPDFSTAGQNAGGEEGSGTRSSLMWEAVRICKEFQPHIYCWENVKNVLSKTHKPVFDKHNKTIEDMGYVVDYAVLNAKDYGIPQNRQRVFMVAIRKDVAHLFPNFSVALSQKRPMKPLKEFLNTPVYNDYEYSDREKYLTGVDNVNRVDPWYFVKYRQAWLTKRMQGLGITTPDKKQAGKIKLIDIHDVVGGTANTIITEQWKGNNSGVVPVSTKEYNNFIVIPRNSDGELQNGIYNRVWKTKNDASFVGTVPTTNPPKIMVEHETYDFKDPLFRNRTIKEAVGGGSTAATITASQGKYNLRVNENKILTPVVTPNGVMKAELYNVNSENYITPKETENAINTIPASGRTAKVIEPYKELNGHLKVVLQEIDNANNVASPEASVLKTITTQTTKSGTTEKILIPLEFADFVVVKWMDQYWNVRILTELECFLLMGFPKSFYERARTAGTRKMMYHVAGNSIVVQCVESIFANLLLDIHE
jgi:DNA-cytosine methyltransferase